MTNETRVVGIRQEPVELFKILKFEGLVQSGGEAKFAIVEGRVRVNGVVERQRRKKIVHGDLVEFGAEKMRIERADADEEAETSE